MAAVTTNPSYTITVHSRESPRKHRPVPTLQDMMSADETLTGLPTRVPERRLRDRKERDVLAAIEKNGNTQRLEEEQPIRRRRKSNFEIYRDGRVEKTGESSFETATAVINTSPASLKDRSSSYREQRRAKEIEALENEYVNDRRAKVASPLQEDTVNEIVATVPRSHTRSQPSISNLLSHGNPDPQFTPLPAPPLSLMHRKFARLSTLSAAHQKAPKIQKASKFSPTPALPPPLPDQEISPLQHMRAFRAHFEALLPTLQPQSQPRRRSQPQASPRQQSPFQQPSPRQSPPKAHSSSSSPSSPASFVHQYAFTLSHLTPLTHHSKTAIVSLTPTNSHSSGFITLQLRNLAELKGGGKYTYIIPTHGLPVTVTDHESGSRHTYEIEDLPLKHLQAVRYAKHFVDVVKKGTIVGRVEVREKFGGGAVWLGRRWGNGRFEALKEGAESGVVVEIQGERGDKVRVFKNGKPIQETTARYEKVIDRAQRMWSACNRVLEEAEQTEDEDDENIISEDSDETTTIRKRAEMVSPSRHSSSRDSAASEPYAPELDRTFRIDATTIFVPNVGWCRRASDNGWWSMLFLDGVRLEIDPTSGDAVWIERGGAKMVLKKGMEMKKVRERVKRFVEQGL